MQKVQKRTRKGSSSSAFSKRGSKSANSSCKKSNSAKTKSLNSQPEKRALKGGKGGKQEKAVWFLKTEQYYSGVIQRTARGYGFLICDELEEDIFIPANLMNGANHNDIVEVRVTSDTKKGLEGEVIGIIERRLTKIVGIFRVYKGYNLVYPDDSRICKEVFIANGETKNAIDGEKVVVEITSFENMRGKVCEVLGKPDEKGVDILSIIRSYNLYETFPSSVEKEASVIPSKVASEDIAGRVDFRNELVITIDGDDSRDFDDAVSLVLDENGLYKLSVHIADVAHYVKHGSKLDLEAYKRGTSVYFPELVLPMLPKKLSNGICSLNENVDRLTLSIIMHIDKNGHVLKHSINEGVIRSAYRMTYKKTAAILDGDKELLNQYSSLVPMLKLFKELALILTKKRQKRGAIDFDLPECQIILDEEGKTKDIEKKPRLVSHRIIEEFMLIANETVAKYMSDLKLPFVYRVHEAPPPEKLEKLNDFLSAMGIKTDFDIEAPSPLKLQQMLYGVSNDLSYAINRATLRSMAKAAYESENRGHYGLAAQDYCHFTSPIRRYPDLIIHRIIKDFLRNGKKGLKKYEDFVKEAANLSSVRERLAEKAERDVDDLKKAEFMKDKVGQEFEGIISSVADFGFFVELDNSIEGLVRIETLKGSGYVFNSRNLSIKNTANCYKIGQHVKVVLDGVSGSKISFVIKEI